MPIISNIGRKHPRVRLLVGSIYLVLTLGALTMVYPFMIMVAGSTKSGVDMKDFEPVPRYLYNDVLLYRKHVEGLFNESLDHMNMAFDADVTSFEVVDPPAQPNKRLAEAWKEFLSTTELPDCTFALGYVNCRISRTMPQKLREFKDFLMERFDKDLDALNRQYGTQFVSWNSIYLIPEDYLLRRNKIGTSRFAMAYREFKEKQPLHFRTYFCVEGYYKRLFLKPQYTKSVEEYNRLHGTAYKSYNEIHLPRFCPPDGTGKVREDWESFVRNSLNLLWIRVKDDARPLYQAFLKAKYRNIDVVNRHYGSQYASFAEVPLVTDPPEGGLLLSDWESFIVGWRDPDTNTEYIAPTESLYIHSVDFMFRDWLTEKHGSLEQINAALGTDFGSLLAILPPQEDFGFYAFQQNSKDLRWEFTTRNYKTVLEYMLFHGRGIINTVIYCALAISLALTVNPLAAYAMSRYQMPTTYKILLFLLLTMAFPPMVTQIPVFLMLRNLGLLNTFAALVLPGMANGYSIFLLKGFFDSLPRELYESAEIDGASEWVMFWTITMSLSQPILAVIALNAFTRAYSNFMFALLLCQDEKMWTLMVWLYQLRARSGPGVIYASLIVAALPTLLVFVFCQNIIMRGIVTPVEK